MWTTFTKSFRLLVSVLALLLPLPFANACGIYYYYGEEYRVALLNPYLIGEEWSAFFYSADRINHTMPFKTGNDRRQNCREWANYIGNDVTVSEVQAVIYQANYDDLLNAVAEGADNQRFAGNAFFKTLLQKEKKPALDYLLLAKENEYYAFLETTDPWGRYMNAAVKTANDGKQAVQEKMIANYKQEKDAFLRRRVRILRRGSQAQLWPNCAAPRRPAGDGAAAASATRACSASAASSIGHGRHFAWRHRPGPGIPAPLDAP